MKIDISLFHVQSIRIKKNNQICDFFCVFFWLFGEKSVPLQ